MGVGLVASVVAGSCSWVPVVEEVHGPAPGALAANVGTQAAEAIAEQAERAVEPLREAVVAPPAPAVPAVPAPVLSADEIAALLAPPAPRSKPPPRPKNKYDALKFDIRAEREALLERRRQGQDVNDEVLALFATRLPEIIASWKGTRWSYSGTTQVPGKGKIACGYFVSTVLEHAGFEVDRVDLARQPSEQIIRSLVPDDRIERFTRVSRDTVADRALQLGDGVYIVGLDTHVGFLVNHPGASKKERVEFCHSTRRDRKAGVVCEDPRTSPSFKSRYYVLGKLDAPILMQAWLDATPLTTARKFVPQELLAQEPEPLPKVELMPPVAPVLLASDW